MKSNSMREAVGQVLFENPAAEALALVAVEQFESAIADLDDPTKNTENAEKAASRWHAAMLSCVRGRPAKALDRDDERDRMTAAMGEDDDSVDEAARKHAAQADAEAAQA